VLERVRHRQAPRAAPDHRGELDFPVEHLRIRRVAHGPARPDQGAARRLEKEEQALRFLAHVGHAHLGDVIVVVGAGAQHLARVLQRRENALGLDLFAGGKALERRTFRQQRHQVLRQAVEAAIPFQARDRLAAESDGGEREGSHRRAGY
jgi:hypothetical protein